MCVLACACVVLLVNFLLGIAKKLTLAVNLSTTFCVNLSIDFVLKMCIDCCGYLQQLR